MSRFTAWNEGSLNAGLVVDIWWNTDPKHRNYWSSHGIGAASRCTRYYMRDGTKTVTRFVRIREVEHLSVEQARDFYLQMVWEMIAELGNATDRDIPTEDWTPLPIQGLSLDESVECANDNTVVREYDAGRS